MPAKPEGERLQKVLANSGVSSRRRCEELIVAGHVTVNDQVVTALGTRVNPASDRIAVDGVPVHIQQRRLLYYALYKPEGFLSAVSDTRGRPVARSLVPSEERLYPVGRLDLDSEGLLLFSNDGELSLRLMHPRYQHEKEYMVLVKGKLSAEEIERLREGLLLEGESKPARAEAFPLPLSWLWRKQPSPPGCFWVRMVLRQGQKRQIRRMVEAVGHSVERLIRVRIGELSLGTLEPGDGRWLAPREVAALRRLAGLQGSRENDECAKGMRVEQDHRDHRRPGSVRQEHRRRNPGR